MQNALSTENKETLRKIAYESIEHGLTYGSPLAVDTSTYDDELQQPGASFVTLNIDDRLRGCIGMLEPVRPLIEDVASNAYSAAFNDSRFTPLRKDEFDSLSIHISILNPSEEIDFTSEQDLISQLNPGVDGIILIEGERRSTFLPSVWESISSSEEFIQHLKQKAGLQKDYWSDSIRARRYSVDNF